MRKLIIILAFLFSFAEILGLQSGDEGERRTAAKPDQRVLVEGRSRVWLRSNEPPGNSSKKPRYLWRGGSFNVMSPIDHLAWANMNASADSGQISLCLRPQPRAEKNGGNPRATDYRKREVLHKVTGDDTLVFLRTGGPLSVSGLTDNGESIGETVVALGQAVEVKRGALPRYVPPDKIPPAGQDAVEVMGLPAPMREDIRKIRKATGEAI